MGRSFIKGIIFSLLIITGCRSSLPFTVYAFRSDFQSEYFVLKKDSTYLYYYSGCTSSSRDTGKYVIRDGLITLFPKELIKVPRIKTDTFINGKQYQKYEINRRDLRIALDYQKLVKKNKKLFLIDSTGKIVKNKPFKRVKNKLVKSN